MLRMLFHCAFSHQDHKHISVMQQKDGWQRENETNWWRYWWWSDSFWLPRLGSVTGAPTLNTTWLDPETLTSHPAHPVLQLQDRFQHDTSEKQTHRSLDFDTLQLMVKFDVITLLIGALPARYTAGFPLSLQRPVGTRQRDSGQGRGSWKHPLHSPK